MDRRQLIGLLLIFGLIIAFTWYNQPSEEDLKERQRLQDSIAMAEQVDTLATLDRFEETESAKTQVHTISDSLVAMQQQLFFGDFYPASTGEEQTYFLENEHIKVTFSNLGGRITEVLVKEHKKVIEGPKHEEIKVDLKLMNHPKAKFEYLLPVRQVKDGVVSTGDLYFQARQRGNEVIFEARSAQGAMIRQVYTLSEDNFTVDYVLETENLNLVVDRNTDELELNWIEFLDKIEKNDSFEKTYSTLQYKFYQDDTDYCSFNKDDTDDLTGERLDWVSNANQFFSSVLMTPNDEYIKGGELSVFVAEDDAEYLKECRSQLFIPLEDDRSSSNEFTFYFGPNDFEALKQFDNDLEETINFGRSVFGTLNRWVIRPLFLFFLNLTNSAGIAILLLIFIVKSLLYPLTYRMLKSNARMSALKPEISQIKEKYKDDNQTSQMKTMELYRKFGVSPFGGCMPMLLQMPIWFALFRFFPAAFEFRQKSFLWATDLSSYDALFHLPWDIPMFGSHLSLFALLWTISTLIYTFYNTQTMDMGNNPAMKYMQYFMPVIFIVFFNNYASGLTAYMFLSNLINIAQTIITKRFVFDDDKIRAELELKKDKPKRKNSFSQRLEAAMKEQQKAMDDRSKKKGKKK